MSRPLEYRYDPNGNRTRVIHPDGVFFEYTFDGLNRAIRVSESGSSTLLTVAYRSDGRRDRLLRPGAATTVYGFNNANRLSSLSDQARKDWENANAERQAAQMQGDLLRAAQWSQRAREAYIRMQATQGIKMDPKAYGLPTGYDR